MVTEKTTTFTPGDWRPVGCAIFGGTDETGDLLIARALFSHKKRWSPSFYEAKANACLIAAAPALYGALRALIDFQGSQDEMLEWDKKARKALALAEGRQS